MDLLLRETSKPDNPSKPSKEAAQPTKVRQRQLGSSFTQVKGAYPEVVNSAVEKQFSMKNENEVLLWVDDAAAAVYIQKESIYMAKSGAGSPDLTAGKVARKALVTMSFIYVTPVKIRTRERCNVMPVKPFLTHTASPRSMKCLSFQTRH